VLDDVEAENEVGFSRNLNGDVGAVEWVAAREAAEVTLAGVRCANGFGQEHVDNDVRTLTCVRNGPGCSPVRGSLLWLQMLSVEGHSQETAMCLACPQRRPPR
jgi:hypothetical protein